MREPVVILCSGQAWDGVTGTHRSVAEELRHHARVLWVDPPVSVVTPARKRFGASRAPVPRLRTPLPGVTRLTPQAPPFHGRKGIRRITRPLVLAQIRWALRRIGAEAHTVVDCGLTDLIVGWGADVRKVFYGTDDYVAGAALMRTDVRGLEDRERRAIAAADLVLAVSPVLADKWRAMGAHQVVMVPNGVQADLYDGASPDVEVDLPHPVAGIVGHLTDRIDLDVLEELVDSGCSLLMVGPIDPYWEPERVAALLARDRVLAVGSQPRTSLPAYLRHVDVGITPYQDTAFNRASFPLKTLDYLAAGLPAVTTDLPAARWLDTGLIRLVSDPKAFVATVLEEASAGSTPDQVAARRDFAHQHSWSARAAQIAACLGVASQESDREVSGAR